MHNRTHRQNLVYKGFLSAELLMEENLSYSMLTLRNRRSSHTYVHLVKKKMMGNTDILVVSMQIVD